MTATPIGELLARVLLRDGPADWPVDNVLAAATSCRDVGLDAAEALSLLIEAKVAPLTTAAQTCGTAYGLDRRDLERLLRHLGLSRAQRRAILGLPPPAPPETR